MKKLQKPTELQQVVTVAVSLALGGLVASVALLSFYIDLMSAIFFGVVLLFIGAVGSGIVVAVVKDGELSRVVRGYRASLDNLQAEHSDALLQSECNAYSLVNLLRVVLDPTHDGHRTAMTDLVRFTEGGEALGMRDETLIWYAEAIWNGEGYSDDDLNRLARIRENYGLTEADYPEATEKEYTETAYTNSASTALYFGTLDKAYTVNGETRYPLA